MHCPAASPLSQRTPTRRPGAAAALQRRLDDWRERAGLLSSGATLALGTAASGVMLVLGPLPPSA